MSIEIKRNKKGLYQLKSSVSNELLHIGWITEDEVKKILMKSAHDKFIQEVIKIDMEFPAGYYVNGKLQNIEDKHLSGSVFILNNWTNGNIVKKFQDICERLNFKI